MSRREAKKIEEWIGRSVRPNSSESSRSVDQDLLRTMDRVARSLGEEHIDRRRAGEVVDLVSDLLESEATSAAWRHHHSSSS